MNSVGSARSKVSVFHGLAGFHLEPIEPYRVREPKQPNEAAMASGNQCSNDDDNLTMAGETSVFVSFECAAHKLRPICPRCGYKIIGHGVEQDKVIYSCACCAAREGMTELWAP
jgi:hypothetical protein